MTNEETFVQQRRMLRDVVDIRENEIATSIFQPVFMSLVLRYIVCAVNPRDPYKLDLVLFYLNAA